MNTTNDIIQRLWIVFVFLIGIGYSSHVESQCQLGGVVQLPSGKPVRKEINIYKEVTNGGELRTILNESVFSKKTSGSFRSRKLYKSGDIIIFSIDVLGYEQTRIKIKVSCDGGYSQLVITIGQSKDYTSSESLPANSAAPQGYRYQDTIYDSPDDMDKTRCFSSTVSFDSEKLATCNVDVGTDSMKEVTFEASNVDDNTRAIFKTFVNSHSEYTSNPFLKILLDDRASFLDTSYEWNDATNVYALDSSKGDLNIVFNEDDNAILYYQSDELYCDVPLTTDTKQIDCP
ncbi:MAG: hypothetical protein KDD48_04865 [Bdellovibrionales bacterium]|nr:hypothetical protein [Bdellovibrionales bacterium]